MGHVIVCGLNPVGLRTVEQLHLAGARVVVLDDEQDERLVRVVRGWGIPHLPRSAHLSDPLFAAGILGARAVVCAELTDLRTLETVLLIRDLRPDVLVVADLDNPAVAHAVEEVLSSVGVLDVAALFAPAVVEACIGRRAREILLGDTRFVAAEVTAPSDGTLRELYGNLAPIGVVTEARDELIACPGRDQEVSRGDRVTVLGTRAELDEAGLSGPRRHAEEGGLNRRVHASLTRMSRAIAETADTPLRIALALGLVLLVVSSLVLHLGYRPDSGRTGLGLLDAVYFTVETVATVGYGDFNFSHQPTGMEVFGIALIVAGTTLVTTLFALLTNALVSPPNRTVARAGAIPGHARARRRRRARRGRHAGTRGTARRGSARWSSSSASRATSIWRRRATLGVPVVDRRRDARGTLAAVNLSSAAAVAILTSDDLTNIETGLAVRDQLGERWTEVPVDAARLRPPARPSPGVRASASATSGRPPRSQRLGSSAQRSGWRCCSPSMWATIRSCSPACASVPAGASTAWRCATFPARSGWSPSAVPGGPTTLEHPPRRDTRLTRYDDAYLVGPYAELLEVLRHDREGGAG